MPILMDEETMQRLGDRIQIARSTIVEYLERARLQDVTLMGEIPCPCCQEGMLEFGYDGEHTKHIRAKCSTEGCATWIE